MPGYVDEEDHCTRRYGAKDVKVHRNHYGLFGPPLLSKLISAIDSHNTAERFVAANGNLRSYNSLDPIPSLTKKDPYGLTGFNVLYSSNKRSRWDVFERASTHIAHLQDASSSLRVSAFRIPIDGAFGSFYERPEFLSRSSNLDKLFASEYHTVEEQIEEIHRRVNRTLVGVLKRKVDPKQQKGRRRKGRRDEAGQDDDPEEKLKRSEIEDKLPPWKRSVHVVYIEQFIDFSPKTVNTNTYKSDHYDDRLRPALHRQKLRDLEALTADEEEADLWGFPAHTQCSRETERTARRTTHLAEFVVPRISPTKRRKRKRSRNLEFTTWEVLDCSRESLEDFPAERSGRSEGEGDDDGWEMDVASVASEEDDPVPVLSSFSFALPHDTSLESFAAQCSSSARRIAQLWPESYAITIQRNSPRISSICIPSNFQGIAIVQRMNRCTTEARCILNEFTEEGDWAKEKASRLCGKSAFGVANFLPQRMVADVSAHSAEEADEAHARKDGVQINPKGSLCGRSPSGDYSSLCGICFTEDEQCCSLECGHFFCRHCWAKHSFSSIQREQPPLKCPEFGCDVCLGVHALQAILPLIECSRYKSVLWKCRRESTDWIECVKCANVLHVDESRSGFASIASCPCGFAVCLKCRTKAHIPLNCSKAAEYRRLIGDISGDMREPARESSLMVKKCPACGEFCQRSAGCNQMNCPCGQSFCFVCCQKFAPQMHYKCKSKNVNFRVTLSDVPKQLSHNFPSTVLKECLTLRDDLTVEAIHAMSSRLRMLHPVLEKRINALRTFKLASELLEFCRVRLYHIQKNLRREKGRNAASEGVRMREGSLRFHLNALLFHRNLLKILSQHTNANPLRIDGIVSDITNSITALIESAY